MLFPPSPVRVSSLAIVRCVLALTRPPNLLATKNILPHISVDSRSVEFVVLKQIPSFVGYIVA